MIYRDAKIPRPLWHRKAYQKKSMEVSRSNGDKQKKDDFEEWEKLLKDSLKEYKENENDRKIMDKVLKLIKGTK